MAEDPHRGACRWDKKTPTASTKWGSLLDWAVYHAPGWQDWQKYRADLTKVDMGKRAGRVSAWWSASGSQGGARKLADAVRTVTVLRSLRGAWSSHPEMKALHDRLTATMDRLWKGETPKGE